MSNKQLCRNLDVQGQGYGCYGYGRGGYGWTGTWRGPGKQQHTLCCLPLTNRLTVHYQDFERKSALFSLASSEVLIVNMWEHQVGLYQGANMSLLKTVFEVNLGLFGKKSLDGYVVTSAMLTFRHVY
jgi:hypothetical protein